MSFRNDEIGERVLGQLLSRRGWLLAYIRAIVRDFDLAEDVFQEVCLTVVRKRDQITPGGALPGYFLKVARHAALALLERKERQAATLPGELLDALDVAWSDGAKGGESAKLNLLRRCIDRLSEGARRLLRLRYEDLMSGKRLADEIALTTKSAYVALSRIHRALRECVARGEGAAP